MQLWISFVNGWKEKLWKATFVSEKFLECVKLVKQFSYEKKASSIINLFSDLYTYEHRGKEQTSDWYELGFR
jgi:hypothetical protein